MMPINYNRPEGQQFHSNTQNRIGNLDQTSTSYPCDHCSQLVLDLSFSSFGQVSTATLIFNTRGS